MASSVGWYASDISQVRLKALISVKTLTSTSSLRTRVWLTVVAGARSPPQASAAALLQLFFLHIVASPGLLLCSLVSL